MSKPIVYNETIEKLAKDNDLSPTTISRVRSLVTKDAHYRYLTKKKYELFIRKLVQAKEQIAIPEEIRLNKLLHLMQKTEHVTKQQIYTIFPDTHISATLTKLDNKNYLTYEDDIIVIIKGKEVSIKVYGLMSNLKEKWRAENKNLRTCSYCKAKKQGSTKVFV